MTINKINKIFDENLAVISESKKISAQIQDVVDIITNCYKNGNKVIIFGNGGSAADAQHWAAELIGRFKIERQSLPSIALTTDTSIITSLGNDFGFDYIFARQCESLVHKGDIVIGISTSGKSQNVLSGILTARKKGARIIGLTGLTGTDMQDIVDVLLVVPSKSTPRIQEGHRVIMHAICEVVEENFKK